MVPCRSRLLGPEGAESRAAGFPGSFGLEPGDLGLDLLCGLERKESQPFLEPGDPVLSRFSGQFQAGAGGGFGYVVVFE